MRTGFTEQNDVLYVDDIPLSRIAGEFGTPAYVYSARRMRDNVLRLQTAFADTLAGNAQPLIAFATKANSNIAVLRLMAGMGLGADVVSGGELARALTAGIPPSKIVFSGVAKSFEEISAALSAGIHQINVESAPELERIAEVASGMNVIAPVAFRLNPDVEANTHAKITTGKEENKFGLPPSEVRALYKQASDHPHLKPCGISLHIGSQLTDLTPYREAFTKLAALVRDMRDDGMVIERLDLGGGLGIVYQNEPEADLHHYAEIVRDIIHPLNTEIILEPGRLLVGDAGILLTSATYVKRAEARSYVILDGGMNDLMRPALYDAWHPIRPVKRKHDIALYDVVGPVCETGDTFAKARRMPSVEAGELVAIMTAGAYGFTMASNYNTRMLPPEVLVDGDRVALVRKRQTLNDILDKESIPAWLMGEGNG